MTGPSSERTADADVVRAALPPRGALHLAGTAKAAARLGAETESAHAALDRLVARNQQLQEALAALMECIVVDANGDGETVPVDFDVWGPAWLKARAALASVRARTPARDGETG